VIELLDNTDEERELMTAKETGILTRGTNIEGVTTAVNLIDDYKSDGDNDESNTPTLMDLDLSYGEDDNNNDNDDTGGGGGGND
jgi:hypothetical protein